MGFLRVAVLGCCFASNALASPVVLVGQHTSCNGTPIAPKIVAAMSYCFQDQDEVGFLLKGKTYRATVFTHPEYTTCGACFENKIALAIVDEEMPANELYRETAKPTVGLKFQMHRGFMEQEEVVSASGKKKKVYRDKVKNFDYEVDTLHGKNEEAFLTSSQHMQPTDVGAPAVATVGGKSVVIGIAAQDGKSEDYFMRMDTSDVQTYIQDFAKKHGLSLQ